MFVTSTNHRWLHRRIRPLSNKGVVLKNLWLLYLEEFGVVGKNYFE
jgi:hypothetical protein